MRTLSLRFGVFMCLSVLAMAGVAAAYQDSFTLSRGQSITVGDYVIEFAGVDARTPYYNIYTAGGFLVQLPADRTTPHRVYVHNNLSIHTTGLSPDGLVATGVFDVK